MCKQLADIATYFRRTWVLSPSMDTLNSQLDAAVRDFMDERGITQRAVARRLDRSQGSSER